MLRYRLKIRVVDVNGNAPFHLWDRECNELLGIATSVLKDKNQESRKLPKEIKSLVGLSMIFKIAARKEQFGNLHNAFPMIMIINDTKLVALHYPEFLDR